MNNGDIIEISELYFKDNPNLLESMQSKDGSRIYIGILLKIDENNYFVPFRTEAPRDVKYQKGIFRVPTKDKPNAGLDIRKTLIINDQKYFTKVTNPKIPRTQIKTIELGLGKLETQVENYVKGYKKSWDKGRLEYQLEPLYFYSTLVNYPNELGLKPYKPSKAALLIKEKIRSNKVLEHSSH